MLQKKLRKNLDIILFLLFVGIIYAGGWQAEVFGFIQRGILVTGLLKAEGKTDSDYELTELNFQLYDTDGNILHVESLEGKTIFINFWATWCPPCIAEMPGIHSLYEKVADEEDIVFLMISVDETEEKAKKFLQKKSYEFPLYFPASSFPEEFHHQSIPATYVVSPEGRLIYQHEGMASYDNQEFIDLLQNP